MLIVQRSASGAADACLACAARPAQDDVGELPQALDEVGYVSLPTNHLLWCYAPSGWEEKAKEC